MYSTLFIELSKTHTRPTCAMPEHEHDKKVTRLADVKQNSERTDLQLGHNLTNAPPKLKKKAANVKRQT